MMNERLKFARLAAGFRTASAAIEALKWHSSKYRAHENGQNNFNVTDAVKYGNAYKVSPGWLLTGEDTGPIGFPVSRKSNNSSAYVGMDAPRLVGYVQEGAWRDVAEDLSDEAELSDKVYLSDQRYPSDVQFDLKVIDDSVDKFASSGAFLRCILSTLDQLNNNTLAVLERTHRDGLRQIVIRRVILTGEVFEFFPESLSVKHVQDGYFRLAKSQMQNDVRVIGKVLFQYSFA